MNTTGRKGYVPANDVAFCEWGNKLVAYAMANYKRWGVSEPGTDLAARLSDLRIKVEKCLQPTRSKVDTLVKNEARKAVEKELRNYVQGMVVRNVHVTDEDREMMGLPIYDVIPTPVGDPVGLVTATVRYPNEGALELQIRHVEGSPYDKRANYGVKIAYGVFPLDTSAVEDVSQLQESVFTRKKKELFTFQKKDARKAACFCCRYENSKGKAGQWGPIISAVIP